MINEDQLVAKALRQPWLGWSGWGRARVQDEEGNDVSITDGMWVIFLGNNGIVGLGSFAAVMIVPCLALWWRYRLTLWSMPALAPAAVLAILLPLYSLDCLANAMTSPIFGLAAGAVGGACVLRYRVPVAKPIVHARHRRRAMAPMIHTA